MGHVGAPDPSDAGEFVDGAPDEFRVAGVPGRLAWRRKHLERQRRDGTAGHHGGAPVLRFVASAEEQVGVREIGPGVRRYPRLRDAEEDEDDAPVGEAGVGRHLGDARFVGERAEQRVERNGRDDLPARDGPRGAGGVDDVNGRVAAAEPQCRERWSRSGPAARSAVMASARRSEMVPYPRRG